MFALSLEKHPPNNPKSMSESMKITVIQESHAAVLEIAGIVNIHTSPTLHDAIKGLVGAGNGRIILRLAEVKYMDSSGVGVLVSSLRYARSRNVPFGLAEVSERAYAIFQLTGLTAIFKLYPDVTTALRELV